MFKSIFSKYLIAFILSIFVSFIILSGIISSIISTHATEEKEHELYDATTNIATLIMRNDEHNFHSYVASLEFAKIITPIVNTGKKIDVLITDKTGKVIMSTLDGVASVVDGVKLPETLGALGTVDMSVFTNKTTEDGLPYYFHRGSMGKYLRENAIVCASGVLLNGSTVGHVLALSSTEETDKLIDQTVRAVFNSSAFVMLAAVIAIYFISERIISPLRNMTSAAKKLANGDYSTRVSISGDDEVANLASAFNNMAESIENLDKMRSSFMASVSHDLRTPMTTISGFIEGITSGAIPPEKHDYYLGIISNEVHRLSRLVTQLLDITRLESGDRKFNFEDFDVAEVARIILISFEQKIEQKRLEVNFECDESIQSVNADKDAIYQVLYNLCHNAIKFASDGAKFEIRIERADAKKVRISVYNEGNTIAKEDLMMVFERFFKSDKSRGLDKSGVGLGLYIAKTIIDAHDEKIGVITKGDVGTEFYFTLKEGETVKRHQKREYLE
jgi:signal transduction histidine kinase